MFLPIVSTYVAKALCSNWDKDASFVNVQLAFGNALVQVSKRAPLDRGTAFKDVAGQREHLASEVNFRVLLLAVYVVEGLVRPHQNVQPTTGGANFRIGIEFCDFIEHPFWEGIVGLSRTLSKSTMARPTSFVSAMPMLSYRPDSTPSRAVL
jgi:hypothetical protein